MFFINLQKKLKHLSTFIYNNPMKPSPTPSLPVVAARPEDAPQIATLIMEAMNHDCCQWFAGPHHTLADFHALMTRLVRSECSQYSYLNTLVCRDNDVVGICTSYDGSKLKTLRAAFVREALATFGRDFSDMDDETSAGELYIDSLCVRADHRGQGLARALLNATQERARAMGLPTGLLVDIGNPQAERLYLGLGYRQVGTNQWGGHAMKHLQRL